MWRSPSAASPVPTAAQLRQALVGTVFGSRAAARQERAIDIIAEDKLFEGDRAFVRSRSVEHALRLILRLDLPVNLDEPATAPDPP